jgi:hypothetical protein
VLAAFRLQTSDVNFCNLKGIAERPPVLCAGASVQRFSLLASVPRGDRLLVDDEWGRWYSLALGISCFLLLFLYFVKHHCILIPAE